MCGSGVRAASRGKPAGRSDSGFSQLENPNPEEVHVQGRKSSLIVAVLAAAWVIGLCAPQASAVVERMSLAEISQQADQIVLGRVAKVECFAVEDGRIYTTATVAVDEQLKGGDRESTLTVTVPGGTVGETTMRMSAAPRFEEGETVVLFLKDSGNRLAGWFQGKYVVEGGIAYPSAPYCGKLIHEGGVPLEELLDGVRLALGPAAE
jgi:hypothetical protein